MCLRAISARHGGREYKTFRSVPARWYARCTALIANSTPAGGNAPRGTAKSPHPRSRVVRGATFFPTPVTETINFLINGENFPRYF